MESEGSKIERVELDDLVRLDGEDGRLAFVSEIGGGEPGTLPPEENLFDWAMGNTFSGEEDVDLEDSERLPKGYARVTYVGVDNPESMMGLSQISKLKLIDRRFVHGDIVTYKADSDHQHAVVTGIEVQLTVRSVQDDKLTGEPFTMDAKELGFIGGLLDGSLVVKDYWLGKVNHYSEELTIQFPNGAIGEIRSNLKHVNPMSIRGTPEMQGVYYPGQKVVLTQKGLQSVLWLRGSSDMTLGVVRALRIGEANVKWFAMMTGEKVPAKFVQIPPSSCTGSELTVLSAYRYRWWRTGDRGILPQSSAPEEPNKLASGNIECEVGLPSEAADTAKGDGEDEQMVDEQMVTEENEMVQRQSVRHRRGRFLSAHRRIQARKSRRREIAEKSLFEGNIENMPKIVEVVRSETTVDLVWQDGSKSLKVPATDLVPVRNLDAYVFFPGQFVKSIEDGNGKDGNQRLGVLHSMNQKDRTARVAWENKDGSGWNDVGKDVSVYDLSCNSDYDLHIGDVVLKIFHNSDEDINAWAGEVVEVGLGSVDVHWNDGSRSCVRPDCLIVLYKDELDEEETEYDENSFYGESVDEDMYENVDDALLQEFSDEEEYGWEENPSGEDIGSGESDGSVGTEEEQSRDAPEDRMNVSGDDQTPQGDNIMAEEGEGKSREHQAAETRKAKDANGKIPATGDAADEGDSATGRNIFRKLMHGLRMAVSKPTPVTGEMEIKTAPDAGRQAEENKSNSTAVQLSVSGEGQHAVAKSSSSQELGTTDASSLPSKEQNETEAEDSQQALVRAVRATHPSFHVLDVAPTDHHFYLQKQPNTKLGQVVRKEWQQLSSATMSGVFVHAYESRLDLLRVAIIGSKGTPYEDCLFFFDLQLSSHYPNIPPKVYFHSHGRRLNPNLYEDGKAIVLTDRPYFNEAGYEKQAGSVEGDKKSRLYNESVLLLTLRHAESTFRNHPAEYEDLVKMHFQASGKSILDRCASMISGDQHSLGFKRSLEDLVSRLKILL